MSLIRLWRLTRAAKRLQRELERTTVDKSLFQSKTFWFNVLTGVADIAGLLPIPSQYTALIMAIVNIGLRIVTDQGVTVLPRR